MNIKEITLKDKVEEIEAIEAKTAEPKEMFSNIMGVCKELHNSLKANRDFHIVTDYDADGITAAYIMKRTLLSINPNANIKVTVNDPRNGYGAATTNGKDGNARYIVMDMGCNDMENIFDKLGQDTIIIDHHRFEDEEVRIAFGRDKSLLNPQSVTGEDGKSPCYCTAGLAYRIYSNMEKLLKNKFITNEKQNNTVAAMAAIGTIADVVDLADVNSFNRGIVKEGLNAINNADEENFDMTIGNFLSQCGLSDYDATAKDIGFKVAPVINAGNRMTETLGYNAAQEMFDTLDSPAGLATYRNIEKAIEHNNMRKEMIKEITGSDNFQKAIEEQLENDIPIFLYRLPDDTSSRLAGLVAGNLCERTGKAVIALTYNTQKGTFVGSGRAPENNETGLLDFINSIADDIPDFEYGGHTSAMGVSQLSLAGFDVLERKCASEGHNIVKSEDCERLNITPAELLSADTLETLKKLEPMGQGFELPPVELKGKELRRTQKFIGGRKDWKTVQMKFGDDTLEIKDWSYSPEKYPQFSDGKTIMALASVDINRYRDADGNLKESVSLTAVNDGMFQKEYQKAIETEGKKKSDVGRP